MFLRGLGGGLGRDGDGLLRAAGLGVFGRAEDLGPVPVQPHRGGPERAADLAHGGWALDAVVAVVVVAGEAAELVAGELGGLGVVRGGLIRGGVAGQRAEFQQRPGRAGAVEVAVGDDGAVVGAFGAAVVRVQVLDEFGAGLAERGRLGAGVAVGVAGVGEHVAEAKALTALGDALDRLGASSVRVLAEIIILLRAHPRWAIWSPIGGGEWTAVRPAGSRPPGPEMPMIWVRARTIGELRPLMRTADDALLPPGTAG